MNKQSRQFIIWGSILGGLAVVLGAFGAHGLKSQIAESSLESYKTGIDYHFYHVMALLAVGLLTRDIHSKYIKWAGIAFIIGIVLFSGSLYLLATRELWSTGNYKWLGPITPIGGVFFIVGWILLALSLVQSKK